MTRDSRLRAIRGRLLAPEPDTRRFVAWPDAVLELDEAGRIASIAPARGDCGLPETWPDAVILPGFVDAHTHFPQTRIRGSASGPLLEWLARTVYPEEARFADAAYAEAVASQLCTRLLAQGTTLAAIYGSVHPVAAEILFEALDARGPRAILGLTWMDREAPPGLLSSPGASADATRALVARWHGAGDGRLHVSVNPRFAIACSPELLTRAGSLSEELGLLLQTHLAENEAELERTRELFPASRDYFEVYESHGCANERAIMAHCLHLSEDGWERLRRCDVAVAHCPDANLFLGSGTMRLRAALESGLRVGLGSDVGAGRTFSMRRVAAAAHDAALLVGEPVAAEELLWLATRGGAVALGRGERLGCLAPGFEADLAVIDAPQLPMPELADALLFDHDAGPVRATIVGGRVLRG